MVDLLQVARLVVAVAKLSGEELGETSSSQLDPGSTSSREPNPKQLQVNVQLE